MAEEQILGDDTAEGGEQSGATNETILGSEPKKEDNENVDKDTVEGGNAGDEKNSDDKDDTNEKSKDGNADDDKSGAPEKYQDFQAPEGIEIDAGLLEKFTPIAKDLNLSQDNAQKLINFQSEVATEMVNAQVKAWEDTQSSWVDNAKNDEEFGKGKFDASIVTARKAMREIGGSDLEKALNETGMGNHPELIRAFYRVGKLIEEDNISFGKSGEKKQLTQAERIFPNQK